MTDFRVSGFHSIHELVLKSPKRIKRLIIDGTPQDLSDRERDLLRLAQKSGISSSQEQQKQAKGSHRSAPSPRSNDESGQIANAGRLVALITAPAEVDLDEVLSEIGSEKPIFLAVDGITDPQNLGALIRSAAVLGVRYLLLPRDRSSPLTETVYKIASGGMEHVTVVRVTNLVQSLEALKAAGYWVIGFSEHAEKTTRSMVVDFPAVVVIGNEEKGIRPLVHKTCDFWVKIHGAGGLLSLNASIAGAIAMEWAVAASQSKKSK